MGATCTHYGGPLAEGRVVDGTIRCPWHHACFDLRTGAVLRAPALNPLPCYDVERADGKIRVAGRRGDPLSLRRESSLRTIAIVGAGAAGESAAETLRREGYDGEILLFGADEAPPVDRPNLSKDYLAGTRSRGMDAAAAPVLLRGTEDRAVARVPRGGDRSGRQAAVAGGWPGGRLGRAPAGDRRRSDPAVAAGRRPAARPHAAHAGRQPRHHRRRQPRQARGRHRRQLHRHGGGGVAAGARSDGRGRRARADPVQRSRSAPSWAASCAASTRSTASASTSVRRRRASRPTLSCWPNGERITADLVVLGVGVKPAIDLAQAAGPHHRPRRGGRRSAADQRGRRVRRRRHRPLPLRADRRVGAHRALGRRPADGAPGGAQHPGARPSVRLAAVLLEHAVRRDDQLRRSRRELGPDRRRGRPREARRHPRLSPGWTDAGGRHPRTRSRPASTPKRPSSTTIRRRWALSAAPAEGPLCSAASARGSAAVAAAVVAATAAGAWFALRSLQQDFAAYWIAATARRLGLDPYVNHVGSANAPTLWDGVALFRHSRFLYPPLVADLFRPLAALPYLAAKGLFTAAMLGAWIGAGLLVVRRGESAAWRERTIFFLASALFFPFYRHLERGQIDLLILLLLAIAWRERARPWMAGAALAAARRRSNRRSRGSFRWSGPAAVGEPCWRPLGAGAVLLGLTAIVDGPARARASTRRRCSRAPRSTAKGEPKRCCCRRRASTAADDGSHPPRRTALPDGHR